MLDVVQIGKNNFSVSRCQIGKRNRTGNPVSIYIILFVVMIYGTSRGYQREVEVSSYVFYVGGGGVARF
jgi:hypothetical protein